MMYYPLIFVSIGLFEVLCTVLSFFVDVDDHEIFNSINLVLIYSLGFWNSIVYLLTGSVKQAIKEDLCSCFFKQKPPI